MTTIIAGRFDLQDEVARATAELEQAGFHREHIASFYFNPPGMHANFPVGGDQDESPGAEDASKGLAAGTTAGGAVGVAVGAATAPVVGPLGPALGGLVGAHVGNLIGSASQMKEEDQIEAEHGNQRPRRGAGMMVAVSVSDDRTRDSAIEALRRCGAQDIEVAQGTIAESDWRDFDPVSEPNLVNKS